MKENYHLEKKFFSSLKNTNISKKEYKFCLDIFRDNNMTSIKDFLVWYNNKDVVPFLTALTEQVKFFKHIHLDMLKDAIGIPGLTLRYLFSESVIPKDVYFSLPSAKNSKLHELYRKNLTGGPSIIFTRYHEKNKTRLRSDSGKTTQSILGLDANALYLDCIQKALPLYRGRNRFLQLTSLFDTS